LFLIPSLYMLLEDFKGLFRKDKNLTVTAEVTN